MLQVYLTDTLLSRFSEPADAERYRQLNIFEPATVTVVIKDDEGICYDKLSTRVHAR